MLRNSPTQFGLVTILLHWLAALTIIALFVLGLYMVELDYYSAWYHKAPRIHESIGLLCLALMIVRLLFRLINPAPKPLKNLSIMEQKLAPMVHALLYVIIFAVLISGYLISTAGNKAIDVFSWFTVPALFDAIEQQQDVAGLWHQRAAWLLIGLTVLHTAAALKHHFIDKDTTLLRIIGVKR